MDTHTTPGQEHAPALAEVLDGLNDLLQLDHDAVAAYDVAIEKLEDRDHADQIAGFRRDHERHIRELGELVLALGGVPRNEPHLTAPFKQAMQSLGGLAGDKGLLLAWRTNELQVRTKYDACASRAMFWPPEVKRTIDRAALDEERHYSWVAGVLQRLGIGGGEDPQVHALNAARERANTGSGLVSQAKEAVAGAAGAVAGKVSGVAGSVGGRVGGLAGSVGERASALAEDVGARVGDLSDTVRERVSEGAGAVRNRVSGLLAEEGAAGRVRDGVEDAAGEVRGAAAAFEGRVRERPLQTLLAAGLAGFVIGRILR
ncbi:MAG TPA: DUF2383 domain-containing protein [Longimicrobiaceae bacterium]|nr:DUF2383 domain-containing protein [Longimicrobiaceae bacterium]